MSELKFDYDVHSVSEDDAKVTAKVAGKDREVTTKVLTVELTAFDSALTIRFEDVEAARKVFDGKQVELIIRKKGK